MEFIPTDLPDILIIQPEVIADSRGFFLETYRSDLFAKAGIPTAFVQDNHSGSKKGALRGLHYQIRQAQGKLVRVVMGEIFDVAVDLRRSSKTFGRWVGMTLSEEDQQMLWIPKGYAHGFYVISEWAEVTYKVAEYYAPHWDRTLLWNDPHLDIQWPIPDHEEPLLSEKDRSGTPFDLAELYD